VSELPQGWATIALGSLAQYVNGKGFKKSEWKAEGLPIIRIQNLNKPLAEFNYADDSHEEKYRVQSGDLLVAWSASLGAYIWDRGKAWLNQHIFRVDPFYEIVDKQFLYYAIKNSIEDLYRKTHGMGMVHVTKGKFEGHEIQLPPLNEQTRIANKLDSLLAKVDVAQTRLEKTPTLLKRFRQSVLAAATSGELTKEWRKDATFGEVVNVGSLISDIRYGTSKKCNYEQGGIGVLRIPNIGENGIDASDLKYANFNTGEKEKLGLKKGDLLVIRSNGSVELVGKAAIVTDRDLDYLFAGYLIRLRFRDLSVVDPKYVLFSLQSPAIRSVVEINARSTSGINNINSKELAALEISLPSYKEQKEIVCRVESLFALADNVEKQYTEAKKRTDRLTQSLLAKAFRGELVPQDPSHEPASELLKSIKAEREQQAASKPKRKAVTKRKIKKKVIMKLNDVSERYLADLLNQLGGEADAKILWNKTDLVIDDFYAKLKQEMQAGLIADNNASSDPAQRKLKLTESDSV